MTYSVRAKAKMETAITNVVGRNESGSAVESALAALQDDKLNTQAKLAAAGFIDVSCRLTPEKPAWSLVVSELSRASEESRRAACCVLFTRKDMLPP